MASEVGAEVWESWNIKFFGRVSLENYGPLPERMDYNLRDFHRKSERSGWEEWEKGMGKGSILTHT